MLKLCGVTGQLMEGFSFHHGGPRDGTLPAELPCQPAGLPVVFIIKLPAGAIINMPNSLPIQMQFMVGLWSTEL